jgi:hypothetical protein
MARQLNSYGEEAPLARPITLAILRLPDIDTEAEAAEAAARVAERKTIRAGLDAWRAIGKAESFENWKLIGAALAVGKRRALSVTGANDTSSRAYIKTFSRWLVQNSFDAMPRMTRTWAIALYENTAAIEQLRSALSEKERRRLRDPQSIVRAWRRFCMTNGNSHRSVVDLRRYALTAWRRFLVYVEALPPADRAMVWQMTVIQTKAIADAA